MNIDQAVNKLSATFNISDFNCAVEIDGGFVFLPEDLIQPIYVTEKAIYGLNGNDKEQRKIIEKAYKKYEEGDYL